MSYVIANTGNPLGRRNLSRLGWDNIPYPRNPLSRSVARLNGEFNPAGGDPSTNTHGAVTYRIDPRTGQYIFSRTDIKPRGVFMQNTFQHPAPPVITPLGVRALPIGKSVTASTMSGMGCGGSCNAPLSGPRYDLRRRRRGRLGAVDPNQDTFIDPNTGCVMDTDGVLLTCPSGPGGAQQPTERPAPTDPGLLQTLINAGSQSAQGVAAGIQQVVNSMAPPPAPPQQPNTLAQAFPWLFQSSKIGNTVLPNAALLTGGLFMVAMFVGGGKRK